MKSMEPAIDFNAGYVLIENAARRTPKLREGPFDASVWPR
jgi:hypothetical protein